MSTTIKIGLPWYILRELEQAGYDTPELLERFARDTIMKEIKAMLKAGITVNDDPDFGCDLYRDPEEKGS